MPKHIYNLDENIVEFKIAHDDTSLYAYYRVVDGGVIESIYDFYTQYIYWKHKLTASESKRCLDAPFNGIISYSRSEKGNEFEMRAPFEGFLLNKDTGRPTLQLGMTINISLSLETSEEDSIPRDWSSDTAATIQYTLSNSTA
ncbi:unnamed protein product [Adineta steineri]|uniref:Uncharacterized protein n=1 Tax=Adineta steineri TaxID=433720 RepID=A0A820E6V5_9BILA|nr:unnamed protein product [Adineta steineri]CAF3933221.1 unnamed protein product [Adineta steineri]CAF4241854.1 unnamed protein product [Adineta steineri]